MVNFDICNVLVQKQIQIHAIFRDCCKGLKFVICQKMAIERS